MLLGLLSTSQALAAEGPPFEFDAQLSLTGDCGTSKTDPIADPGCPEQKPPSPFASLRAIAIDSFGNEYVASYSSQGTEGRIDVFSSAGVFITEVKDVFGPRDIAVDSHGILYTFDQSPGLDAELARFVPTVYKPAEGKIEYGNPREKVDSFPGPSTGGLAIDANDHVFVAVTSSIEEYKSAEEDNEPVGSITNDRLRFGNFVAIDQQRRRLYASSCPDGDITHCWILVFDVDTHELLKEVKGPNPSEQGFVSQKGWISVASDEETGDFFVGDLELDNNVYQFNEDYELISTLVLDSSLFLGGEALQIAVGNADGVVNHHYLFVPSVRSPNRALAFRPPAEQPPVVNSLSFTGIGETEVEPQAAIEPRGGTTEYTFQLTTQQAYEEAGNSFSGVPIAGGGTIVPAEQEAEVSVAFGDLDPGTAYRVRVFAENAAGSGEGEATFTTYDDAPTTDNCPNQILRLAYSALLPDCRAYELVTPADTGGQPPSAIHGAGDAFHSVNSSPSGNVVSFLTHGGSIPGLGGAGVSNGDPYLATRGTSGWSTELAGPDGTVSTSPNPGSTSPDQQYSFWEATSEGPAVIDGKETRYVRYPDGSLALVGRGSLGTDPRARGKLITENGTHIVFETNPVNASEQPVQLEPDAPPTGTKTVYDRTADEVTHVVSLLPGNEAPAAGENAFYVGASADGNGIAFGIGNTLYLRKDNAVTYEIGTGVTFAGVSEGGERIFYVEGGDLLAFDTATEAVVPFSETGDVTPVNVAPGGTRAYFVSPTVLGEENPNGAFAQAGKENLYLSEEGQVSFIGTVTARDVVGEEVVGFGKVDGLGLWTGAVKNGQEAIDPSRLNPDGSVFMFQSRANLDAYDPDGAPQVYRYDAVADQLRCISCVPTKTAAAGGASLESYLFDKAAPPPFNVSGFVPNLTPDGKRVFFQSTEALVSADNNGVQDVYEWEDQGIGSCNRPGGCIYLITSGSGATNNYLYAMSRNGNDVFFTTNDVLVAGDNDTLSIYDARVGGGFPEAFEKECEGEGCKPGINPSPPLAPMVTGIVGPSGNASPGRTCPKGKHKVKRHGKTVCIKKKKKAKRKGSGTKKGASK